MHETGALSLDQLLHHMASAIPYNPDDFEDNNPFGEPVHSVLARDTNNEPDASSEHEQEQSVQNDHNIQQQPDAQAPPQENDNLATLVKDELAKLLPERFTDRYSMKIVLRGIEKNKAANPILRFDAEVSGLRKYRQKVYKDVRRTYNEVVKFNNYLIVSNLEVFVPVIPAAQTAYPTGGEDEQKQLMQVWQEWFDRVTKNPILVRDDELVYFIESDFGYSVINAGRKTLVASGLVRRTLKQLAPPYDPYTELAAFRPVIKSAYLLCGKLEKAVEKNQKNERQLAANVSEFGTKLRGLAQFETAHAGMRNMWEKLGKVAQIQSDLGLVRLVSDAATLGDGCKALASDFFEIKEALTNRHLIMREYLQAQAQTKTKHLQAAKVKSKVSLDPIKVDEALRALEYATQAEENLQMQVKRISGEMMYEKSEVITFVEGKFQRILKQFTLSRVDQHRRFLKHLEAMRLDVRIIDLKGGLSRLNRDNLTQMQHNLAQSQAATGDAWTSRTFRSLNEVQAEKETRLRKAEEADLAVDATQAASVLGAATF